MFLYGFSIRVNTLLSLLFFLSFNSYNYGNYKKLIIKNSMNMFISLILKKKVVCENKSKN